MKKKWMQKAILFVMAIGMILASLQGRAASDNCPYRNLATSNVSRFDNKSNYYRFVASQPSTKMPTPFKSMPLKAKGRQ